MPLQRELQAEADLGDSRARAASLWPNPRLNLAQERFSADGGDTTQRFYSLSQEFDLSGQRGLRTRAARAQAEGGVGRDNAWTRLQRRATLERLVPILMTALPAGLGLLPLALSASEPGNEIQAPMAMVILFGLGSSTLLNMVVLPVLYLRFGAAARA